MNGSQWTWWRAEIVLDTRLEDNVMGDIGDKQVFVQRNIDNNSNLRLD